MLHTVFLCSCCGQLYNQNAFLFQLKGGEGCPHYWGPTVVTFSSYWLHILGVACDYVHLMIHFVNIAVFAMLAFQFLAEI